MIVANDKQYLFEKMKVPKAVMYLVIPTIISQLITIIYNWADIFFVGQLNDTFQMAAITICYPAFMMTTALSNLLGIGGASAISRALGNNNYDKIKKISTMSLLLSIILSIIYSLIVFVLNKPLLYLLGADNDTIHFAEEYLFWVVIIGSLPSVVNYSLSHLIRATGKSQSASIGIAMGGIINLGNEIAGPRAGGYVCTDVEEILNLPDMDFTKGRIQETLLACKKLREEGEHVVFEVAGPFTILNVLIDARYVFKGMRKKPEVMEKVFWKLGDQILKYMELVKEYGGDLISYADSSGGVNILGPKMMEAVTVNFTYPFLKKVEQLADDKTMILLCPKTTLALIGTEKAKFVDHQLEEPIGYAQACIHMIGKAHFAGQMCIKNVGYQLNHGIFKEVKLL